MILPKIALRNLSRQKRRSILLGSALSFGMLVLVAVNGITGGLVASLQKNFADLVAGHIFFMQVEKGTDGRLLNMIKDDSALLEALSKSGLKYTNITRRTSVMGTVIFAGESSSRRITGIKWNEDTLLGKNLKLVAGNTEAMADSDGIVISTMLAEKLGLLPKQKVTYAEKAQMRRELKVRWKAEKQSFNIEKELDAEIKKIETQKKSDQLALAPKAIGESVIVQLKTIYGQQNVADFRVAGIFDAQMDIAAYVDRERLNTMVDMPAGSYNLFGLILEDYSQLDNKTQRLYKLLEGKYDLVPMNKTTRRSAETILQDIKKEKFSGSKTIVTNLNNELGTIVSILTGVQTGSFVLFLIILAVVMVGLVNTFRIVIYERTREIGTMRAIGAQRGQIRNLFLLEALFLSVCGCIPGTILGVGVLCLVKLFEFSSFTELSYFLDGGHLAFTISPWLLAGSFLTVITFTLLAALLPARHAARMQPAQALRTQF